MTLQASTTEPLPEGSGPSHPETRAGPASVCCGSTMESDRASPDPHKSREGPLTRGPFGVRAEAFLGGVV
jgi:hypothetical protein